MAICFVLAHTICVITT
uniref:Uncharacterized protein n=1 Tax=Anguilla anguilla TaxID=7936 RepID=A0A0E9TZF0_ANGAN